MLAASFSEGMYFSLIINPARCCSIFTSTVCLGTWHSFKCSGSSNSDSFQCSSCHWLMNVDEFGSLIQHLAKPSITLSGQEREEACRIAFIVQDYLQRKWDGLLSSSIASSKAVLQAYMSDGWSADITSRHIFQGSSSPRNQ